MAKDIERPGSVAGQHLHCQCLLLSITIFPAIALICLFLYLRFSTDPLAYILWERIIVANSPRWGYIDHSNKLVVDFNSVKYYPHFSGPFVEDKARIEIRDPAGREKYLFIDRNGRESSGTYSNLKDYSDGLAAAEEVVGGGFGYVDQTGRWAIEPAYRDAQSFKEGLAAVQDRNSHRWGFIDKSGKIVIACKYSSASAFCDGLAVVSSDNKFGYIDRRGHCKIALIYDRCWDFSEGLAAVEKNLPHSEKYERIYLSREGRAAFKYVGIRRNLAIGLDDPTFNNGLALKYAGSGFGYIDKSGKFVIPPRYGFARPFKGKYAIVGILRVPNLYGAIDTDGKLVLPYRYKQLGDFAEGLASATENNVHFGYVSPSGVYVIAPTIIGGAHPFSGGVAAIGRPPECNL